MCKFKMIRFILCTVSYFVIGAQSAKAPFITPCKLGDDACLVKSAQAAIPHIAAGVEDLGISSADPFIVNEINQDHGDLKLRFKEMKITGLSKCNFVSGSHPDKSHLEFVLECPVDAVGKYTLGGKLSVVTVEGDGDFEIKTEKLKFDVKMRLKEENGFMSVEHFDYTFDPVERFHFKFDNLFNGDEEKSKPVHTILNESWKEVVLEVGKPIIDEVVVQVKDHIAHLLKAVPSSELIAV